MPRSRDIPITWYPRDIQQVDEVLCCFRFKFDREEAVNLKDEEFDINMLTGFLKLFLRELPEPIIPFNQYPIVENAISECLLYCLATVLCNSYIRLFIV